MGKKSAERREEMIALREQGLTQKEIATACGVSCQRVSQVLGRYSPHLSGIITKDQCIYEGLRKWMNENHIYATEMVRILHDGCFPGGRSLQVVYNRLTGKSQFKMAEINKLLDRSGLTYEELFRSGGGDPLTLEELRQMDAPVWCVCKPIEGGNGYWCLCRNGNITTPAGSNYDVEEIPHWVFLRRKPEVEG